MGTNFAPLVADLFLFCYEREFMSCIIDNTLVNVLEIFQDIYIDGLMNIDNPFFEQIFN